MSVTGQFDHQQTIVIAASGRGTEPCRCGRCRGFFRAGSGLVPRAFGDWWAAPPCAADPWTSKQGS